MSNAHIFYRRASRWLALLAALLAVSGARAEESQTSRFLLVFEASPAMKKNLPMVRQTLDQLFSNNLQNEIRENDDLAVWTVDEELHTGTFPLANWSPDDAQVYSDHLKDFLGHQRYSRHASLDALQPLLNRVAKSSQHLTVLIFCDSQSRLLGTPYDTGVNEIVTNAAARSKSTAPFVLVLRAYDGEYLGCSVNRSLPLNIPAFPPPPAPPAPAPPKPKAEPPPVAVVPPAAPVQPIPALIIVGTYATTNAQDAAKLQALPKPPVTNAPPVVVTPLPAPTPTIATAPKIASLPRTNPPPVVPAPPAVVANAAPPQQPPPAPPVTPAPALITNAPETPATNAVTATAAETPPDTGTRWPLTLAIGSLVLAAGLAGWLLARIRRPRGSLITSSMQDDPNFPPRK